MLKTSQLEIFESVAEYGSVNRAAEKLHTSQPYISRVIKSMEEELGKTLFVRSVRGVELTRDGKFLHSYAKSILSDLKKIDEMKNLGIERLDTRLQISVYSLFTGHKLFADFVKNSLSDTISLSVKEGTLEELFLNVLSGESEVGIAVINDIEYPAVSSAAAAQDIKIEIWDESPLYVHLGSRHPAYTKEELCMKDILYSTYVHIPLDQYSKARLEIEIDGYRLKEFKQTMSVDNYRLIPMLVKETDSFMFGNKWQLNEMSHYGLGNKRIVNTDMRMHLTVLTRKSQLSAETEKVLEMFKSVCYINKKP